MSSSVPTSNVGVSSPLPVQREAAAEPGFARAAWERWKKLAHAVGIVQTRLLLVVFYFLVVFPLGMAMRLSGDRLGLKVTPGSHWILHRQEPASLETVRRQF